MEKSITIQEYAQIWEKINQNTLENFDQESINYTTKLDTEKVKSYFQQTSQYKIIDLTFISKKEQQFIESVGLSLNYLNLNQKLITSKGVEQINIEFKPLKITEAIKSILRRVPKRSLLLGSRQEKKYWFSEINKRIMRERCQLEDILKLALDDGYVYAICPSSGKIIKSNRSFLASISPGGLIFYRFVGNEVFYLLCGGNLTKISLYFPRLDLIVLLDNEYRLIRNLHINSIAEVKTDLKSLIVTNWSIVKNYILNQEKPNTAVVNNVVHTSTFHHVTNFLAAIQKLYDQGYFEKISQFLLVDLTKENKYFFGAIEEIFPEIAPEKIQEDNLLQKILSNNLFVVNSSFNLHCGCLSDNLANRIHQLSLRKCHLSCLDEIKKAKEKCFPLLWISFRTHKRIWVSQVAGIANLIKTFTEKYPNLGVIFDGYTRTDIKGELLNNPQEEAIIQQEKDVASQIQSLLPPSIQVYNLIGCPMHEVVAWAYAMDLYMVPVGSGIIKVLFPNKPGVMHSYSEYIQIKGFKEGIRENNILPVAVPKHQMVKLSSTNKDDYDFDWKIAYEKLLNIMSSIKRN